MKRIVYKCDGCGQEKQEKELMQVTFPIRIFDFDPDEGDVVTFRPKEIDIRRECVLDISNAYHTNARRRKFSGLIGAFVE